jgi:hypothetical protein
MNQRKTKEKGNKNLTECSEKRKEISPECIRLYEPEGINM